MRIRPPSRVQIVRLGCRAGALICRHPVRHRLRGKVERTPRRRRACWHLIRRDITVSSALARLDLLAALYFSLWGYLLFPSGEKGSGPADFIAGGAMF